MFIHVIRKTFSIGEFIRWYSATQCSALQDSIRLGGIRLARALDQVRGATAAYGTHTSSLHVIHHTLPQSTLSPRPGLYLTSAASATNETTLAKPEARLPVHVCLQTNEHNALLGNTPCVATARIRVSPVRLLTLLPTAHPVSGSPQLHSEPFPP